MRLIRFCSLLILVLFFISIHSFAAEKEPDCYSGIYKGFTNKEGGTLAVVVISTGDKAYVQLQLGFVSSHMGVVSFNSVPSNFKDAFINLKDVKIKGNKLIAQEWEAEFIPGNAEYGNGYKLKISKGLAEQVEIYNETKLGEKIEQAFNGLFPQASYKLLSKFDLAGKSKTALGIMRNEIYFRYFYKFQRNGPMDNYFKEEEFAHYFPYYDNVDNYLTTLEKQNIQAITKAEKDAPATSIITDTITTYFLAQQGNLIDPADIHKLTPVSASAYIGRYHWGDSEGESTMSINIKKEVLTARLTFNVWDETNNTWKLQSKLFRPEMRNGQLYLDNILYDLVELNYNGEKILALLMKSEYDDEVKGIHHVFYELGYKLL